MGLFERNLAKCGQSITIEDRNQSIVNGKISETFSNPVAVQAIVSTLRGVSVFDDTNTERVATHKLCMAYTSGITSEKWVKIGTKRIKILTVENCCEKDEILILMCTERGDEGNVVNEG